MIQRFIHAEPAVLDWHFPSLPATLPADHRAHDSDTDTDPQADVLVAEPEIAKPPMYAVVMYNDNYTPMEFVVYILQSEFRHNIDTAVEIMLTIHNSSKGIAGIYPKDIAETKAKKVNSLAHREGYPLLTQIEPHQGE
ncbi:ATP-dependent Clp protease adaptor ClpS [Psychrobacter sp. F1192]|uniref:ATP-dependent Clp protease adapter protein ClpS n=1 Tax=Psychrobacter coccoides TaxID=2818440 RepID=A0ABS3NLI6_9GAMM|nr:ATP-dependent Clp protease adaptor ClpS [Psychrobacter coccoides]MBO1529948.1 ATP-dependent Clp protease adaptor ClpS [Psychrobacter coccoides]